MKRIISIVLAVLMVCSLAACNKGGSTNGTVSTMSKEYVFRMDEEWKGDPGLDNINAVYVVGDRIYYIGYSYNAEGDRMARTATYVVSTDKAGEDRKEVVLQVSEEVSDNMWPMNYSIDEAGNIYAVYDQYAYTEDENGMILSSEEKILLYVYDSEGNVLSETVLGVNSDTSQEYYWVNGMACVGNGKVLLSTGKGATLYDTAGTLVKEYTDDVFTEGGRFITAKDGTLYIKYYKDNKPTLAKLNADTLAVEENFELPSSISYYSIYTGAKYDFIMTEGTNLYGYNAGDTEAVKIMDAIDSDLMLDGLYNLVALSETEFLCTYYDDETNENVMAKFVKVPPEEIKDKKAITIACCYLPYDIRRAIIAYNKGSEEYKINVLDYSQYNTDEDYTLGVTKLNNDIAAGNIPDIVIITSDINAKNYVSKGMFEDLYPYIDKDPDMNREDYLQNVLDAYSVNGKLYQIAPYFNIYTVVGKTSLVGDTSGWTMEDLNNVMASMPEGTEVFTSEIRESILRNGMNMVQDDFINYETGKCSFNTKEFEDFLTFISQFPADYEDYNYDDNYWNTYESRFRENRTLLMNYYFSSFRDYIYTSQGYFGEPVTFIGFPNESGNGSAIIASRTMAISSKSANKEGAWEFIRTFLLEDYQMEEISWNFPIMIRALEKQAEEARQKPYYLDENGNKVEYDDYYYVAGQEIMLQPLTKEETDSLIEFIKSVENVATYDESLLAIITEEAESYFAGQKSVSEVASIIQSRVEIYINERR